MILVDTSVWIELLRGKGGYSVPVENLGLLATCPPIIQEVLQGIKEESHFQITKSGLLAMECLGHPINLETYLEAASVFRFARKKGLTVRSSTDCLIAAIAIEHNVPVWHRDRDFKVLSKFTNLQVFEKKRL